MPIRQEFHNRNANADKVGITKNPDKVEISQSDIDKEEKQFIRKLYIDNCQ